MILSGDDMEDRIKQLEEEVKMWRDRYEALKRWVGEDLEDEWTCLDDSEWTWYYDESTGEMYAKDYQEQIKHRIDTQQKEKSTEQEETDKYQEYIKALNEDTYQDPYKYEISPYFYSPEANGTWNAEETYYNSESEGKETRD